MGKYLRKLQKFIQNIGLQGKWSSPGGNSKKFTSTTHELALTWYYGKQKTLTFQGKDGDRLKASLINLSKSEFSSESTGPCSTIVDQVNQESSLNFCGIVANEDNIGDKESIDMAEVRLELTMLWALVNKLETTVYRR